MSEEEIKKALKIIKKPITVNSAEYKFFDEENYNNLIRVYQNCLWFIRNFEEIELANRQLLQENEQLKKDFETELDENYKLSELWLKVTQQKDLYKNAIDNLEKWLKEDLGVIYTAESMSGREFTTAKEVPVVDVLKKINELKGVDE